MASPIFLTRSPESATEYNRNGLTNFNPVGLTSPNLVRDSGLYLLRTGGLPALSSPIPGVGLGGLAPSPKALSWMNSCRTPKAQL